ncbi:MAG: acetyltransferase [Bacteroidetes bacterium]|nr:acetyltransferase [Bacteroidota bacterium]
MAKQVIIIGGKGNGGVAAACINDMRKNYNIYEYEVFGFLNDFIPVGETINGYKVLGVTKDIKQYLEGDFYFIYAIHSVSHGSLRIKIFESLGIPDEKLVTLIHPLTFVGEGCEIKSGVMIMANSYIGPKSKIGKCTFVMANCAIGHDITIGNFCHFSMGSTCGSIINIGTGCDVAINATVLEKVTMGDFSVVGAGALCIKDVEPYQVVVGNPAKHLKYVEKEETKEEWEQKYYLG